MQSSFLRQTSLSLLLILAVFSILFVGGMSYLKATLATMVEEEMEMATK